VEQVARGLENPDNIELLNWAESAQPPPKLFLQQAMLE
jgi:hypothetical protein